MGQNNLPTQYHDLMLLLSVKFFNNRLSDAACASCHSYDTHSNSDEKEVCTVCASRRRTVLDGVLEPLPILCYVLQF